MFKKFQETKTEGVFIISNPPYRFYAPRQYLAIVYAMSVIYERVLETNLL